MCTVKPFLCVGVLIKTKLVPFPPFTSIVPVLLPFLVTYEISAHAPMDVTSSERLQWTGNTSIIMS